MAAIADEARQCIIAAATISKIRNGILHGAISRYDAATQVLRFVRLDIVDERTMHQEAELLISARELLDCGVECMELVPRMHRLTQTMMQILLEENPAAEAAES